MDFWDLTKLLFRRWYVALPLLLVTMSVAGFIGFTLKPDYVATSYVQLVPPNSEESANATTRNPWMSLGLGPLAKAAIVTVTSKTAIEQLTDAGYTDNFTMTMESGLPLVTIEVTADSKDLAGGTADELVRRFTAAVSDLQRQQGASTQIITVARLGVGDNLEKSSSKKKRALVAVAAAGLLMSIALTVGADAWLRRRARRRAAGADPLTPVAGGGSGRPSPGYRMTPPGSDTGFGYASGRDGEGRAAAGGSDSPRVEFRSAAEPEPAPGNAGGPDSSHPTEGVEHQESTVALRPMGPDATIILPLSHKDNWTNRDSGSKRR